MAASTPRIERLLTPLRESIIDKPPYISGTLQLPDSYFSLFYKVAKDDHAARHINLANATPDEVEQLTLACEPAGKMGSECFSPMLDLFHTDLVKIVRGYLLEGTNSKEDMKIEPYELNVYSKGSSFEPRGVDTPRSEKMFGSLVIVFPTPHEGGALRIHHRGQEWIFDSDQALATKGNPSIGYVAFFSDVEHEVAPVISGHRVTLTYNLYFDDGGPVSVNDAVSEYLMPPKLANEDKIHKTLMALLENPEFLAEGGILAFGLRHIYPIKRKPKRVFSLMKSRCPIENYLHHIYYVLKGSDALAIQSAFALGFEPVLYLYYEWKGSSLGVIIDKVIDFDEGLPLDDGDDLVDIAQKEGGILVAQGGTSRASAIELDKRFDSPEQLEWVTPMTTFNRQVDAYSTHGEKNFLELKWVYGYVCLVVRIGKAGDRLAYPTVAELKRAMLRKR